ncbi:unnamed protein product [Ixodes hexagonus]
MKHQKTLLVLAAGFIVIPFVIFSFLISLREPPPLRVMPFCTNTDYSNAISLEEPDQMVQNNTDLLKIWNPEECLSRGNGRLPFPVEKTGGLPNAHNTVACCRDKSEILFFIHSAAGHKVHRDVFRRFIGDAKLSRAHNWTTVFFVGMSGVSAVSKAVDEEAAEHGDVVVLPYHDTYQNLTYKFVYGMKWTMELCPSVKYIVKIDDDVVANLVRVVEYLRLLQGSQDLELHCYVWASATVFRETNSPWYMPTNIYPNDRFPDYCSGRGVLFKSEALRRLYSASFCLPFHGIDDVYVTGDAALWAKVGHVAINSQVSQDGDNWEGVAKGSVIFSHIHSHTLRTKAWELIVQELQHNV